MQKPKIVFLDVDTLDLGDINTQPLKQLGDYHATSLSHVEELSPSLRDASILICNKVPLKEKELPLLPNLKLICITATGVNNVDLNSAKAQGIAVCNVAGYSTTTVVEHALLFLLAFSHRLFEHHESVITQKWSHSPRFAYLDFPYRDLSGKTLGLIGYGTIGRRVAKLAKALGMKILIGKIPGRQYAASPKRCSLKELLKKSDYINLHCALSQQTQHLINAQTLAFMKPCAYLLNLGRGPLVNESDVALALENGTLAGYASDVMAQEPPPTNSPLLNEAIKSKVIFTPHIAWASQESRQRLINEIALNIQAFLKGKKRNRIV
ncbi:MAG: D-2-hydroxyacid dehydrogenase [Deltaproteobacteria bacterium]|nr:D-2-hydroxyacid dehydrogenase [Deltaproteobacteria bacterium]